MPDHHWQKSAYSPDASDCVHVAASAPGTIHLRESDEPDVVLTTTASGPRASTGSLQGQAEHIRGRG
ncbi:DUF397 domain-containing protein [Streptomyces sp. NPDC017936]|uniref:DUF397 domain-containing protein n=1 Tax=Streptomyces sp. NPDC017936 TaxID=3365016 RepID=UPI00379780BB